MEQYTRKHNLEIHGIAETADEDIAENVVKLGKVVNVHISPSDIDICHRMGPRNSSGPKPIIVRLNLACVADALNLLYIASAN